MTPEEIEAAFAKYAAERCNHALCYSAEGWDGCTIREEDE